MHSPWPHFTGDPHKISIHEHKNALIAFTISWKLCCAAGMPCHSLRVDALAMVVAQLFADAFSVSTNAQHAVPADSIFFAECQELCLLPMHPVQRNVSSHKWAIVALEVIAQAYRAWLKLTFTMHRKAPQLMTITGRLQDVFCAENCCMFLIVMCRVVFKANKSCTYTDSQSACNMKVFLLIRHWSTFIVVI